MWAELPIGPLTPSLTAITMGWGMGAFNAALVWTRILRGRGKITVKQLNKVKCKVERMRESEREKRDPQLSTRFWRP